MNIGTPLKIGDRVYYKNPDVDRYQVAIDDLGDLRIREVPPHSHLEIMGLSIPEASLEGEVFVVNGGDAGEVEYIYMYGGVSFKVRPNERARIIARLRRAFPERQEHGYFPNPGASTHALDDGILANVYLSLKFQDAPDTLVREAIIPFKEGFERLCKPGVYVFICHSSEDKPQARELATAMKSFGAEVWFDEWEIRVGDSIVNKINEALGSVTHLLVLLSQNSVKKPWVQKELSSALMRQLSNESIVVLPLRLDNCVIPPILADIKYADMRDGIERVLNAIEESLYKGYEPDVIA